MILFYGASVTQQENGYVDEFQALCEEKVCKLGFGGTHLNNAAICFLNKVIEYKPRVCFVDWFSTGYHNGDGNAKEYLNTIIYRLNQINCAVICLLLPQREEDGWRDYYKEMRAYMEQTGIPYIPIYEFLQDDDWSKFIKDSVHTTSSGAKAYAQIIWEYFKNLKSFPIISVNNTPYTFIKRLPIHAVYSNRLLLEGDCHIVGLYNKIGPHSGIVQIKSGGAVEDKMIWDRWCNYTRNHFNLSFDVNGKAEILIKDTKFDTSTCHVNKDFSKYRKRLVVNDIYYIGNDLKLLNKKEGHKVLYNYMSNKEVLFNFVHKTKKIIKKVLKKA